MTAVPRGVHHHRDGTIKNEGARKERKKGKKKTPSFSRSRTGKEGNTDIDFKIPEITRGTRE